MSTPEAAAATDDRDAREPRMRRRDLALLFVGLLGFFGFFAHGYVENTDALASLHAARAFVQRGDLGFVADAPDTWPAERYLLDSGLFGMDGRDGTHRYLWFPIGHQLLMVPCHVVGAWLADAWPEPATRFEREHGPVLGDLFWSQFVVSWIPAFSAAGSVLALLALARALGATARQALVVVGVACLSTQFWPGSSETLSDQPGMCCLLVAVAAVARYAAGASRGALLVAGIAGGLAVLIRYPHALQVGLLCAWAASCAWRRGRAADLAALVAGGAPFAIVLLAANWLRFGSWTETGYSAGATETWWNYPVTFGLPLIFASAGKGILWFSPPLIVALWAYRRRELWCWPGVVALLALLIPALVSARTAGWAGGQCWSVRYLTASVVLVVVVALTLARPWARRPRAFAAVCVLGLLVSLGGVLTPYRGQQVLAHEAAKELYRAELESGEITVPLLSDRVNFAPVLSPLHTHWLYAVRSATGAMTGVPTGESLPALFGTEARSDVWVAREDRGFRHWWIPFLALWIPSWPGLVVGIVWLLGTAAALVVGMRAWLGQDARAS